MFLIRYKKSSILWQVPSQRVVIFIMLAFCVCAAEPPRPTFADEPELAAKYPGDVGIEENRAVIFAEDFEKGTLQELVRRWTDASNRCQGTGLFNRRPR